MRQMKNVVRITKVGSMFDHSSCHDDALHVCKMNVNPGGKQRVTRDGW